MCHFPIMCEVNIFYFCIKRFVIPSNPFICYGLTDTSSIFPSTELVKIDSIS